MRINTSWLLALLLFGSFSCKEKKPEELSVSAIDIRIDKLPFDTLYLEPGETTQYGRIRLHKDEIVFLDASTHRLHRYNVEGKTLGVALGRGQDPFQVGALYHFMPFLDRLDFLVTDDFTLHHFVNDSTKRSRVRLDIGFEGKSEAELQRNPDPNETAIYWPEYPYGSWNINQSGIIGEHYFLPIKTEHPLLNAYMHTAFYKQSHAMGKFSIADNRLVQMGVSWPDTYLKHQFIPNLASLSFSIAGDRLWVSFFADPNIYVYDADFRLIKQFGREGEGMQQNFRTTQTFQEADAAMQEDLDDQSVYGSLYADEDYVFRTYFPKGYGGGITRLQIYDNELLIADVDVAPRFTVLGKIGDYYYADGIVDERNEVLAVFRFSLD